MKRYFLVIPSDQPHVIHFIKGCYKRQIGDGKENSPGYDAEKLSTSVYRASDKDDCHGVYFGDGAEEIEATGFLCLEVSEEFIERQAEALGAKPSERRCAFDIVERAKGGSRINPAVLHVYDINIDPAFRPAKKLMN
jgi:hypothetical protein